MMTETETQTRIKMTKTQTETTTTKTEMKTTVKMMKQEAAASNTGILSTWGEFSQSQKLIAKPLPQPHY
jgi:hypothetical protein